MPTSRPLLCDNYSYLLVGCLGGPGRAISLFLPEQGARNFIFVPRSGLAKQEVKEQVLKLEDKDARVIVGECDVGNIGQLDGFLKRCYDEMPPIRGVIQGAMVLKVSKIPVLYLRQRRASEETQRL